MATGIVLAGGKSERFGGADALPKPAVLIQEVPMVLHVAATLVRAGCRHIIVLTGANHNRLRLALQMGGDTGSLCLAGFPAVPVTLRYSGDDTGSGGRLRYITAEEFGDGALMSYTDVFTDYDLARLAQLRVERSATMALLAVNPRQPWGRLELDNGMVTRFLEKASDPAIWINGGFFATGPEIRSAVCSDHEDLEKQVMERLIANKMVVAAQHPGWWTSIDSPKDLRQFINCPNASMLVQGRPSIAPIA